MIQNNTGITYPKEYQFTEWPGQTLDPYPIKNLLGDLKWVVHRRCSYNLIDLEGFCKIEWENIAKSR